MKNFTVTHACWHGCRVVDGEVVWPFTAHFDSVEVEGTYLPGSTRTAHDFCTIHSIVEVNGHLLQVHCSNLLSSRGIRGSATAVAH